MDNEASGNTRKREPKGILLQIGLNADNWQHELLVEKIHPAEEGTRDLVCLEGAGACPPEDVGGISGYEHFLEAMADPKHPEHQDYRAWIGGDFNPHHFDPTRINQRLRNIA